MTYTNEKYERTQQGNLVDLQRPPVAFVSRVALLNTTRTVNICRSSDAIDMKRVWTYLLFFMVFALQRRVYYDDIIFPTTYGVSP